MTDEMNKGAQARVIMPTIGRVLLYYPCYAEHVPCGTDPETGEKSPVPVQVCAVHSDRMVNVGGFDANGVPFGRTFVQLVQPDDDDPDGAVGYCRWMPFQIGQASVGQTGVPEPDKDAD